MQKGIGTIQILVILALLVLAGSVGYYYFSRPIIISIWPSSGTRDSVDEVRRERALTRAIFDDVRKNYAEYCPQGVLIQADNYDFQKQEIDLNNDGLNEVIVTPLSVCEFSVRGASANGDFIIFAYQSENWVTIGRVFGLRFSVLDVVSNGYKDIETHSHLSAGKQQVDLWQWDDNETMYKRTRFFMQE
jgi:hypothetical protein